MMREYLLEVESLPLTLSRSVIKEVKHHILFVCLLKYYTYI